MKNKKCPQTEHHSNPTEESENILDLLAMPGADEIEFEPPRLEIRLRPLNDPFRRDSTRPSPVHPLRFAAFRRVRESL